MVHIFFQSESSTLPVTYIYKRALHRTHPFSAAHHHNLLIYWNSDFSQFLELAIFRRVPLFSSFYVSSTYLMALPRVLVLGDSFIRRLRQFVLGSPQYFSVNCHLTHLAVIKWHGIGGCTVTKTVQHDLHVIKSFKPDIIIIQLGSNDLTSKTALHVGSSIDYFVRLLHYLYYVKVIYVCQTIMRQGQSAFIHKAKLLTKYLQVVLEPVPYAHLRGHRSFWRPSHNIYVRDGVHLNCGGQGKFYRSLRGAILGALSLITVSTS